MSKPEHFRTTPGADTLNGVPPVFNDYVMRILNLRLYTTLNTISIDMFLHLHRDIYGWFLWDANLCWGRGDTNPYRFVLVTQL